MLASIGQCVALVTHAEARLKGREVELDWRSNQWFAHVADYRFCVGEPGGPSAGDDPNEWFKSLRESAFEKASLFVEPFNGSWDAINGVGFAGGLRMAPVTRQSDGTDVIWHERPRFDPELKAWHMVRGGFRVLEGQKRVLAEKESAGPALHRALGQMVDFAREYRSNEPQFVEMFLRGRRQLQAAELAPRTLMAMSNEEEIRDRVLPLFPPRPEPKAVALVAAVEAAWALGGMGGWNDWSSDDDGARMLYRQATFAYYEAMIAALAAACASGA